MFESYREEPASPSQLTDDSCLDELSRRGNSNLKEVVGKRNKWSLASGNKLLPLLMLRRKARAY